MYLIYGDKDDLLGRWGRYLWTTFSDRI